MMILRRIPTTIAVISVMVIVASDRTIPATGITILEATPQKLVVSWFSGSTREIRKLATEHCKKFDKVWSHVTAMTQSGSILMTFHCVDKNELKTGEGITAGKSAKTPTLRDKPDKELCWSLPYGNPDFAKEAERRELTEKKCEAILGR